jgi:type IV pilus assembly protein PilB
MHLEDLMNLAREEIDLTTVKFTPRLLGSIPRHVVLKYRALPVFEAPSSLGVAIARPVELDTVDSLNHLLRRELEFRLADDQQLGDFLGRLYGGNKRGER